MSSNIYSFIRLVPRESEFLDRKSGSRGEIFFNQESSSLRIYDGRERGGIDVARADLENITDSAFLSKALAAGVGTGGGNVTVSVSSSVPTDPSNGNLWLSTETGALYVYINDGDSNQWIQPAVPTVDLTGLATEDYVDTAISNIPEVDLTGYATETFVGTAITDLATEDYVDTAISNIPEVDLTGYATETFVGTAISNLIDTAPTTLNTLNELAAALGDDANFATTVTTALGNKAPINDPTFTGTVSGITSTMVGLGNVTNESKATLFTSPTFTGTTNLQQTIELLNTKLGFDAGTGFNNTVFAVALQNDGKILVGGQYTSFDGETQNRIIRLNADGSNDTGFVVGTGFNQLVNAIAIQADGKILVGGAFTTYDDETSIGIIRLNADGSIDTGFFVGTGFSGTVQSIALESDGKILVGGSFTSYNGVTQRLLTRLNTDGSRDTEFDIGTGFAPFGGFSSSTINAIVIQADGKILVGGDFDSYNDETQNNITRLNTDGSRDTAFVIGTGFSNVVNAIAIQDDGKILVGGVFISYNEVNRDRIARLNSNGLLDTNFTILNGGFNSPVQSIALQSDGKILVVGSFTAFNSLTLNNLRIARLNADGTLDTEFDIGSGFGPIGTSVYTVEVQDTDQILVAGDFTSYNGITQNRIVQINPDGIISSNSVIKHDFSTGAIWHHSSILSDFTANFINVPTTNNRTTVVTLILSQGGTAYIPNAVQINSSGLTINWLGGAAPTGTVSGYDKVSFTLIRVSNTWVVLGSLSSYETV